MILYLVLLTDFFKIMNVVPVMTLLLGLVSILSLGKSHVLLIVAFSHL